MGVTPSGVALTEDLGPVSRSLRWPGFVEFDDVNGKVLTYSAHEQVRATAVTRRSVGAGITANHLGRERGDGVTGAHIVSVSDAQLVRF